MFVKPMSKSLFFVDILERFPYFCKDFNYCECEYIFTKIRFPLDNSTQRCQCMVAVI